MTEDFHNAVARHVDVSQYSRTKRLAADAKRNDLKFNSSQSLFLMQLTNKSEVNVDVPD